MSDTANAESCENIYIIFLNTYISYIFAVKKIFLKKVHLSNFFEQLPTQL